MPRSGTNLTKLDKLDLCQYNQRSVCFWLLKLRESLEKFKEKMLDPEVIKEYSNRKSTVEPVFGHVKSHRNGSRFMVWGLEIAETELTYMCIVHNIF